MPIHDSDEQERMTILRNALAGAKTVDDIKIIVGAMLEFPGDHHEEKLVPLHQSCWSTDLKRIADSPLLGETTITIKRNPCLTNDPCALCNGRCDPLGLDAFREGTSELVCDDCAKEVTGLTITELRQNFEGKEDTSVRDTIGIGLQQLIEVALACPAQSKEQTEAVWHDLSEKVAAVTGLTLENHLDLHPHGRHELPRLTPSEKAALPDVVQKWMTS
jgi:hypothetical protein